MLDGGGWRLPVASASIACYGDTIMAMVCSMAIVIAAALSRCYMLPRCGGRAGGSAQAGHVVTAFGAAGGQGQTVQLGQ